MEESTPYYVLTFLAWFHKHKKRDLHAVFMGSSFMHFSCIFFIDGGFHLGGHINGCISAYGQMHSPDDGIEVGTTISLLIGGEGEHSDEPFQLKDCSTW